MRKTWKPRRRTRPLQGLRYSAKGGCIAEFSLRPRCPQQVPRTNNFNGLPVKRSLVVALNRKGFLAHCQKSMIGQPAPPTWPP